MQCIRRVLYNVVSCRIIGQRHGMASTLPKKQAGSPTTRNQPVLVALGKRIKALRIESDMSQLELAFGCELDRSYISLIERGQANPSMLTIGVIAYVLQVSLSTLFEGNKHTVLPSAQPGGAKRRGNQASHEKRPPEQRRKTLR